MPSGENRSIAGGGTKFHFNTWHCSDIFQRHGSNFRARGQVHKSILKIFLLGTFYPFKWLDSFSHFDWPV